MWINLFLAIISSPFTLAARLSDEVSNDKFNDHLSSTGYFSQGKRKFSVIATREGYYPEKLAVFAGEEITLFFTNTEKTAHCLTIPEKNVFLSGVRGSITETMVSFDQPGKYLFYCPSMSHRGEITVLPRLDVEGHGKVKRSVASIEDQQSNDESDGPWIPRDE